MFLQHNSLCLICTTTAGDNHTSQRCLLCVCVCVWGVLQCCLTSTGVQLDAGEEHAIQGKTVRVNRAGPRPALHLLAANSDPGRQGISHASSAPMSGGVSCQRGGHSTSEPSTSNNMLQNLGTIFPDLGTPLPDLHSAVSIPTLLADSHDEYALLAQATSCVAPKICSCSLLSADTLVATDA
jgi:hypothetical protein